MQAAPAILAGVQAVGAVAKGASESAQAMSDADRMEAEARLADTQALQRDTNLRDELNRFLSATESARAANGLSSSSPNALLLMKEAGRVSARERTIQTANDRQRAANLRAGARGRRKTARMSLFTGAIGGAIPLIQTQV